MNKAEARHQFQFRIAHLSWIVTGASIIMAFYHVAGLRLFALTAVAVVFANLLGLIVGWFVTYVLKIPNDGSNRYDNVLKDE